MMNPALIHEDGHRLASLAKVLKANEVPQETVNMILAACCGLPMEKVDPKSPCFQWAEEPEAVTAAMKAQAQTAQETPDNSQRRSVVIRAVSGLKPNDASQLLASALNSVLADTGTVATIHYHCLISRG